MDESSIVNEILEAKLQILKKVESYMETALKEKNSAMVAAIAEVLKSY